MKTTWFMPDYYEKFHCKADKCRHTCCRLWRIPVSKETYHRLITMDCSAELSDKIARCFSMPDYVTNDHYRFINFNYLGECPLLEKGLCLLHGEKGEAYLPQVCNLFPRSFKSINGHKLAVCSASCEGVTELLYESDRLKVITKELDLSANVHYELPQCFADKVKSIQQIFADTSCSLKDSIEKVCLLINEKEYLNDAKRDSDPLKEAMAVIEKLTDQRSDLYGCYEEVKERYAADHMLYEKDTFDFEKRFPNWMVFFENLLNNSMMYENFPFVDNRFDETKAFKGLCASYGLLRYMAIGYTAIHQTKEDLIDVTAALFHLIDHTAFYYNAHIIVDNAASFLRL